METLNVTKEQLLIDALAEYVNCRNNEERQYTGKGLVRLAVACDKSKQLFNLIIHNIDLYKIKDNNRRRNLRYYLMRCKYEYEKICNALLYVDDFSSIRYDTIVDYISKSEYDTEIDIEEYFENSINR